MWKCAPDPSPPFCMPAFCGFICCGVMHGQSPGWRVAVCGSCRGDFSFAARVAMLAWVCGLTFLAHACGEWLHALVLLMYACQTIASLC